MMWLEKISIALHKCDHVFLPFDIQIKMYSIME